MPPKDRRVHEQVQKWRDELINLSRRNRLLYFKHTKTSTLEIKEPGYREVVRRLAGNGRAGWSFYSPLERSDVAEPPSESVPQIAERELLTDKQDPASLQAALRILDRKASQEYMDKGLWILYLGVGLLKWLDPDDDAEVVSPIVLLPVKLFRSSPREPFTLIRADDDPILNPALAVKMESEFGLTLPSLENHDDLDVEGTLLKVERMVRPRGWGVSERVVLATFSFHKEVMYQDLKLNEDEICAHAMVRALGLGSEADGQLGFDPVDDEHLDESFPPEELGAILDADASQRRCMAAAQTGHSFVMDGPPGTGKSQTIANLIADGLLHGRRILFVSEKAAALEVVYSRLEAAGLGEYLLELHSYKATRREVAQHLARALLTQPRPPTPMSNQKVSQVAARRRELSAYAEAVNQVRQPLGRSLHNAMGRVAQLHGVAQAPPPATINSDLEPEGMSLILDVAGQLSRAWGPVTRTSDFLWRGLRIEDEEPKERQLHDLIDLAASALQRLERETKTVADATELWWINSPGDSRRLRSVLEHLAAGIAIPETWLSAESLDPAKARTDVLRPLAEEWLERTVALSKAAGKRWRQLDGGLAQSFDEDVNRLRGNPMGWLPPKDAPAVALHEYQSFFAASSSILNRFASMATSISEVLGIESGVLSLDRAEQLAKLGTLSDSSHLPEAHWIDPSIMGRLVEAQEILGTLLGEYRRQASNLSSVFDNSVLDLDLQGLELRFRTVHRGLRKLAAAYRADKRLLASCSRSGKATKEVIAALALALEWQGLDKELAATERKHAGVLGGHYYEGKETDFDTLAAAIEVARSAVELAGTQLSYVQLQNELGRGGLRSTAARATATELVSEIIGWRLRASEILGQHTGFVATNPLEVVVSRSSELAGALGRLASLTGHVEGVRGRPTPHLQAQAMLKVREQIHSIEEAYEEHPESDQQLLGGSFSGLDTDWADLTQRLVWGDQLRALVEAPVDVVTATALINNTLGPKTLSNSLQDWDELRDDVVAAFQRERATEVLDDLEASFVEGAELLAGLSASLSDTQEWYAFSKARLALSDQGFGEIIDFCIQQKVSRDDVVHVVERAVLERWVDDVIRKDGERLSHLRPEDRATFVREFQELDRELLRSKVADVIRACNSRHPTTTIGAAGVLLREGEKKRRHMPVRILLEKTAEITQLIKPCFMMSPLSVSQFLPADLRFDLVIFDEASQVRPADAVNCIYRGDQLIVAGDQKQLPPTSFFERTSLDGDDEYEDDQFDEFESVLDLAKAGGLESLSLRWHYRSRHESLITYSNYSFYDGRLITFPGAFESAPDMGVELMVVDGIYRRGGPRDNPVEAKAVVERVLHYARHRPDLTLGVVAFSEAQATAIDDELERRRKDYPELDGSFSDDRLNGFFVKNLENVQGDERDVMIFSIGYGFDENGKFTLNFGPLNKLGGHRRLNVAITRARQRVEVLSSIIPEHFQGSSSSAGVRHLKRYLEYAKNGIQALALDVSGSNLDAESPFEEEVLREIRSWGFDAEPQVGVADYRIDIGIRHPEYPGKFVLGVECDGAMYHSSRVARDRDRLRQEVLEGLGWNIYRVWGPSWYRNRAGQSEALLTAIEESVNGRGRETPKPPASSKVSVDVVDVDLGEMPSWTAPYKIANLRVPAWREMHEDAARGDLKAVIAKVIDDESPVASEIALRRVREAWGLQRAGGRIRNAFSSTLLSLTRYGPYKKDRYGFLWAPDKGLQVRVPIEGRPETIRKADEIAREELDLAVQQLVHDAKAITWDELTATLATLFGWGRRGSDIASTLDRSVKRLLKGGVIREEGEFIKGVNGS